VGLERAGHQRVAQHVGNAGCGQLLLQDALLVGVTSFEGEPIQPVAGVVERSGPDPQRNDVAFQVGDSQPGALLPREVRTMLGDERAELFPVGVVAVGDGWDSHVHARAFAFDA
jgi:hypothetical protein